MIISAYGIVLQRLQQADIELVRQKRNSPEIQRFMEYREEITPEMQLKWFHSVNNEFNNYFIIISGDQKAGMVYGAGIDWNKKETGNGGIFIWDENFRGTQIPLAASLLLTDLSFLLGFERTYIKVLKTNTAAIAFDINLGYELLPGQENVINQKYVLTEENYMKKSSRFRNPFIQQFGEQIVVKLEDAADAMTKQIIAVIPTLDPEKTKRLKFILP
jgi:UDP-4-amino-4,6-dideoxy-N-acetyl-beta-L-altrosamine N-acetyltransferase